MKVTLENIKVGNTVIGKITADNISLEKLVEIIDEISTSITGMPQKAVQEFVSNHEELLIVPEPQEQTLEGFWDDVIDRIPKEFEKTNITKCVYEKDGKASIEIGLTDDDVYVRFFKDRIWFHITPGTNPKLYCSSMPVSMYGRYLDSQDIPENIKDFIRMLIIREG